jgi:hypothetical protein
MKFGCRKKDEHYLRYAFFFDHNARYKIQRGAERHAELRARLRELLAAVPYIMGLLP